MSWWQGEGDANDRVDGNHGTLMNGATFAAGTVGQAFSLDGVNDWVSIPDAPSLRPTSLTIEGWFNFSNVTGGRILVGKTVGTGGLNSYALFFNGSAISAVICDLAGTGPFLTYTFTPTLGVWYHIAYTYDDATDFQALYVNGVLRASGTVTKSIAYDSHPVQIGVEYQNEALSAFFAGLADEVTIYNRALSAVDITDIFNADGAGKCAPAAPVCTPLPSGSIAWWRAESNTLDGQDGNHGFLENGAGYVSGLVGQAFATDGVNDFVRIPDAASVRQANLTIEGWFRFGAISSGLMHLVSKTAGSTSSNSYVVWIGTGRLRAGVGDASSFGPEISVAFSPALNTWYHVAYTFDDAANTQTLYLNGEARATGSITRSIGYDTHPVLLGAEELNNTPSGFMNGAIDDVALYSRALTASEIRSIYNADGAGKCFAPAGDRAPVLSGPTSVTGSEDVPLSFTLAAGDPDGPMISSLSANLSGLPAGHGATFTANGSNTAGVFSWTPTLSDAGTYTITFTATNTLSGTLSTQITVSNKATLSPGDLYTVDFQSTSPGRIIKVDPTWGIQTIVLTGGGMQDPSGMHLSASGEMYVTDYTANSLFRVDLVSGTLVTVSPRNGYNFFVDPFGVTMGPDGQLYVTDFSAMGGTGALIRVDPATGVQSLVSHDANFVDPGHAAISSTGEIFVSDTQAAGGNGAIVRVNAATGAQTILTSGGNFIDPHGVAFTPSGDLAVPDFSSRKIVRVDPTTGAQTVVASGGYFVNPVAVAFADNGDWIVTDRIDSSPTGQLVRVDPASGAQKLVHWDLNLSAPSWSAVVPGTPALTGDLTVNAGFTVGAPASYDNIVVQSGAQLYVDAPLTAIGNMTIQSSGIVTHSDRLLAGLTLNVAGALDVQANGFIDVNSKGLRGGRNGSPFNSSNLGETYDPTGTTPVLWSSGTGKVVGGAGYGGNGATGTGGGGSGAAYGVLEAPQHLGSGGGGVVSEGRAGGNGGGRVTITAGTLVVNGTIRANGGNGSGPSLGNMAGGGSGGAIWITVSGTFSGATTGQIQASGGTGGSFGTTCAGSGGGGRIAIYYGSMSFPVGNIVSRGGDGSTTCWGGAGTIYLKESAHPRGDLRVDNVDSTQPWETPLRTALSPAAFRSITVRAGGILDASASGIPGGTYAVDRLRLESFGTLQSRVSLSLPLGSELELAGGVLNVVNNTHLSLGYFDSTNVESGTIWVAAGSRISTAIGRIAVGRGIPGATVTLVKDGSFGPFGDEIVDLTVLPGGVLTHTAHQLAGLTLNVTGALDVQSGGFIDANSKGLRGGRNGSPFNSSNLGETYDATGTSPVLWASGTAAVVGGAGYGGRGATGTSTGGSGAAYGVVESPQHLGSGGGGVVSEGRAGGNGGGRVTITAGSLVVNGTIRANGGNGSGPSLGNMAGGGSGGAIWITVSGTFTGGISGQIQTSGGTGGSFGTTCAGSGGGGRIAIYYGSMSFPLDNIVSRGGDGSTTCWGGAGTVYLKESSHPRGDLVVDNEDSTQPWETPLRTALSPAAFRSITVKAGGILDASASGIPGGTYTVDRLRLEPFGTLQSRVNLSLSMGSELELAGGVLNVVNNTHLSLGYFDSTNVESGTALVGVGSRLSTATNVIIVGPAGVGTVALVKDGSFGVTGDQIGDLTILSGGAVTHSLANQAGLNLVVSNTLDVRAGGSINLSAVGLRGGSSGVPGFGTRGEAFDPITGLVVLGSSTAGSTGAGGSYGGRGLAGADGGVSNLTYGVPENPVQLGSGGAGVSGLRGGHGGGRGTISSPVCIVNGAIRANGEAGFVGTASPTRTGAGSGGSLRIDVGTLSGTGFIEANAGATACAFGRCGGVGGGGRVAIFYDVLSLPTANIRANGGSSDPITQGSVYLQGCGRLTISPSSAANRCPVTAVVIPRRPVAAGAFVKLIRSGQADIVGSPSIVNATGTRVTAAFDLGGRALGAWDVVVVNADNSSQSLPAGFTVVDRTDGTLSVAMLGRGSIRVGTPQSYTVLVHNTRAVACAGRARICLPPGAVWTAALYADLGGSPTSETTTEGVCITFPSTTVPPGFSSPLASLRVTLTQDPPPHQFEIDEFHAEWLPEATGCAECADPAASLASTFRVTVVRSYDPNTKSGPTGVGPERWIRGDQPLSYSVLYENLATASAPAQRVVVTDALDVAHVDLRTLTLAPLSFGTNVVIPPEGIPLLPAAAPLPGCSGTGAAQYETDVDLGSGSDLIVHVEAQLDSTTGVLTVSLQSIDAATGQPPTDPTVGFLPPNVNPPEGEGDVHFTVMPRSGLATGTQIPNAASIVFDSNPAIQTPTWVNTIDNSGPQSNVLPLAAIQEDPNFTVEWTGTDQGSGILDYTVFVSDNGGPYAAWVQDTTATSGVFPGQSGHTYAFYSVARDRVGHVEAPPDQPDATTQVIVDRAPVVVAPETVSGSEGAALTIPVTASDPDGDAIASLTADLGGLPAGHNATFTPNGTNTSGPLSWTPSYDHAGSYAVRFIAANTLSDTTTTQIVVANTDRAPIVTAPASVTGSEGAPLSVAVTAQDPDGDAITSLTANLGGLPAGHAAAFTPNGTNTGGTLTWTPTFSDAGSYGVTFTASNALTGTATTGIVVTNADRPPVVTAPALVQGAEGTALSVAVTAADPDGEPVISLTAAPLPSGAIFTAAGDNLSGALSWTPDFAQAGSYTVTFTASNALSGSATTVIEVSNTDRAPQVTAPALVQGAEGVPVTFSVTALDPDGESITSFTAEPLPTGAVFTPNGAHTEGSFSWTPDFTQAGSYTVTFTATNALSGSASTTIEIANTDRPPVVTAATPVQGAEGTALSVPVMATDPDGDAIAALTASNLPTGASFTPSANQASGTLSWTPDFTQAGSYDVTFIAANALSDSSTSALQIANVDRAPVVTAPPSVNGAEGAPLTVPVTVQDPDGDAITALTAAPLPDGADFAASGDKTSGTLSWTPTYAQAGSYTVTFTATNALTGTATSAIQVANTNRAPVATITSPPSGSVYAVGTQITFTGSFTDDPEDSHTAQWQFDTITVNGVVNQATDTVSATHTFTAAGVYRITLTVTDNFGASGTANTIGEFDALVVVYDPNAGFVTGGGWVDSPAGAYAADPGLVGKANFGFVSKYKKGATVPTGETEFQFRVADLSFHSALYEWLVVSGSRAQFKGSGTINGSGSYGFLLTATDGQISGGGGTDKFRMKIWDKANGDAIIYDNQMGAADDANPVTALGGGSIVIHVSGRSAPGEVGPLADRFALAQNRPNPFNPRTVIPFSVPHESRVRLAIYDSQGRLIATLWDDLAAPGRHEIAWNGRDDKGRAVASGVYYYKLEGAQFVETRRMLLLK